MNEFISDIIDDEVRFRYAINFDLSIRKLQQYFSQEHPKSAYGVIAKYMREYDFEHRQYSGYISNKPITQAELIDIVWEIHQKLPWLYECENRMDATVITRVFDMKEILANEFQQTRDNNFSYNVLDNDFRDLSYFGEPKEIKAIDLEYTDEEGEFLEK